MSESNEINGSIISGDGSVAVIVNGDSHTVAKDHVNYDKIIVALKNADADQLVGLMDLASAIKKASAGRVVVECGGVYYNGNEVKNTLTDRILNFVAEGLPFGSMVSFLDNLLSNPSRTAIQELYLFDEHNSMPITEDGYMLAYRRVRDDYRSFHVNPDGTYNTNKVGDIVFMERNEVDDRRDALCSYGLHFCSLSYIPKYFGGTGRVMIVKINPADVVSIPSDYDNAKGRCCYYEVIAEHTNPEQKYEEYSDATVVSADGGELDLGLDAESALADLAQETDDGKISGEVEFDICTDCGAEVDLGTDICDNCQADADEAEQDLLDEEDRYAAEVAAENDVPYHNVRNSKGRFTKRS
jgi:hypothetical protein